MHLRPIATASLAWFLASAGIPALAAGTEAPEAVAGVPGAQAAPSSEEAHVDKVCRHYENRARFKPRDGAIEFVTVLAEACRVSLASLASDSLAERATAQVFLQRLRHFHDTIIAMNTERVFGSADPQPYARPSGRDGTMMGVPQVTPAGEFLIAHHMGLVDALDAWLGTGVEFSIAFKAKAGEENREVKAGE